MNAYTMCPCCGRSILADEELKEKQRGLWDEKLKANAEEHGGEVWTYKLLGRVPGGKLEHDRGDAPRALVRKVRDELVRRCKAFLEKVGAR